MSDRRGMQSPVSRDPHVDLLDDARTDEAVADRARRRLLAEAEDLDATFHATLRAAAATGAAVLADTTVGRSVRGRIEAVGATHVVVRDAAATSYARIDQLTAVRALAGGPPVRATPDDGAGGRPAPLVDVLAGLAHERTRIDAHLVGGSTARGAVRRVGTDVLTLRADHGGEDVLVNLALAAVITVHHGSG